MDKGLSIEALNARRQYNREYMKRWRRRPGNKDKQKEYEKGVGSVTPSRIGNGTNEKGVNTPLIYKRVTLPQ